jgi:large subunit ribosomal protein L13e
MVRMVSPVITSGDRVREGKGFSVEELKAVDLTPGEATRMGIPHDPRRRTSHEDNVETLKEYLKDAKEAGVKVKRPRQTCKPHVGRVYRGKTSSGKKMRNLTRRK